MRVTKCLNFARDLDYSVLGKSNQRVLMSTQFVESLESFPKTVKPRKWILRFDNNQHYHAAIPKDENPLHLELSFRKSNDDTPIVVGRFKLHLHELLVNHYVREERLNPGLLRIRITCENSKIFYLQLKQGYPKLQLIRSHKMNELREQLVRTALAWEQAFGNAPSITSALSELDVALLVGSSLEQYSASMSGATAVQKGHDFVFSGKRYQVKANRPSGKPGSPVTLVSKATNYEWDFLIWVFYNPQYQIQEAWLWDVQAYQDAFDSVKRLSPEHYRKGRRLV